MTTAATGLKVHCHLLPQPVDSDVAVVIDVLRMTTTAAVLFDRGLRELLVVAEVDHARRLAVEHDALLLGERGGVPLEGFSGGNSPREYLDHDLREASAILCTSNGSRAVEAASGASHLLLASIRNAGASARAALSASDGRIDIVCSGTGNRPSLDDVVGAGIVIHELLDLAPDADLDDAARLALLTAAPAGEASRLLRSAQHARTLERLGFAGDIELALERNATNMVPVRRGLEPAIFVGEKGGGR